MLLKVSTMQHQTAGSSPLSAPAVAHRGIPADREHIHTHNTSQTAAGAMALRTLSSFMLLPPGPSRGACCGCACEALPCSQRIPDPGVGCGACIVTQRERCDARGLSGGSGLHTDHFLVRLHTYTRPPAPIMVARRSWARGTSWRQHVPCTSIHNTVLRQKHGLRHSAATHNHVGLSCSTRSTRSTRATRDALDMLDS